MDKRKKKKIRRFDPNSQLREATLYETGDDPAVRKSAQIQANFVHTSYTTSALSHAAVRRHRLKGTKKEMKKEKRKNVPIIHLVFLIRIISAETAPRRLSNERGTGESKSGGGLV